MKIVENADGTELTKAQRAKEFTFAVSFSDGNLYQYYKGDDKENLMDLTITDKDTMVGTLTLRHGEIATFVDVPVGVVFTVKEQPETGYRAMSQSHQISAMLPDADGCYQRAEFINTYETDSLVIDKEVRGRDADAADEFIFTITFSDDGTYDYVKYEQDGGMIAEGSLGSGDQFTLKGGERIEFLNLPVGLAYKVTEQGLEKYVTVSAQEYEGTIFYRTDGDEGMHNQVHFINYVPEEDCGSLEISKTILNYKEELAGDVFKFQVAFSDGGTYAYYYADDASTLYALENGEIVVLKHGQSVIFTDIPEGVYYTVTELRPDGYQQAFTDISGYIRSDYRAEVRFINRYIDEEVPEEEGGFYLTKLVDGSGEMDGTDEFFFTIKFYDTAGAEASADEVFTYRIGETEYEFTSGAKIALKKGETAQFYDIPQGYTYVITEEACVGYIKTAESVSGDIIGGYSPKIVYDNLTDEEGGGNPVILADLTIRKSVYGDGADAEQEFEFLVEFADGEQYSYYRNGSEEVAYEFPQDGMIRLRHGEYITFIDIPEGTGYKVTELRGPGGYQADIRVMSGTLSRWLEDLHFYNYRSAPVVLTVEKVVEDGPSVKDEFTFTVTINGESETFTLKDGECREFIVYAGDEYEVIEADPYRYGYLQKSITNGSGIVGVDITEIEVVKTNIYTPSIIERTGVSVEKEWMHGLNTEYPGSVYVQLYRDGKAYGPAMILSEDNGWWHTWVGLNKAYTWTVDEKKVPQGYEKHITGDVGSGFVITNVHESDDGTGKTPVDPGDAQDGNEDPDGSGERSGADGSGDGAAGQSGSGDVGSRPKTGDATEFWLWSILMIASAIVLRHILFGEDKRSKLQ